jgi:hypothetical protein
MAENMVHLREPHPVEYVTAVDVRHGMEEITLSISEMAV